MIYIGYVITVKEALRLLGLNESIVSSFYDTEPIQKVLEEKGSQLDFKYIDKGACVFGIPVCTNYGEKYATLDDCIFDLILVKRTFHLEILKLKLDISEVNLTWIESEEQLVKNPEGYLIDV